MAIEARRDVFQAIADPTRRQIIKLVANRVMNLNDIADNFDISRPAISQHIKILNECGLIEIENIGRERFCKIQPGNLIPAFLWIEQFQKLWEKKLDSFENYLNQLQTKNKKNDQTKRNKKSNTNIKKNL
jgi:DNA-binding transcriptional ArsR family regulator